MKRTAVYIATTEGPSEIQRITPEDSDVRSVVCHDGKALALPISADYDSFVRRPTGVIEACFGHNAYRVDLAAPIANGLSWQLGLFIGHALFDENRLVRTDDKTPQIVWATGEVTRDLAVDMVTDVDRKIRQSERQIRAHLESGSRMALVIPVGNLVEANKALEDVFGSDRDQLHIVPARTVCEVLTSLGLRRRRRTRKWLAGTPSAAGGHSKMLRHLLYMGSFGLLAVTVSAGWQKLGPQADLGVSRAHALRVLPASFPVMAPSLTAISIATRAPDGQPCAAVHLDQATPLITRRTVRPGDPVSGLLAPGLCDFNYRLTNSTKQTAILWVLAQRSSLAGEDFRSRSFHAEKVLPAGNTLALDARPPRKQATPLRQSFAVLTLLKGPQTDLPAIRSLWQRVLQATSENDQRLLLTQMRSYGVALQTLTENFTP